MKNNIAALRVGISVVRQELQQVLLLLRKRKQKIDMLVKK